MTLFRRARTYEEMTTDSQFPYQVGRLVGASSLAARLLVTQDDPDVKQIGAHLDAMASWFYVSEEETKARPPDPKL